MENANPALRKGFEEVKGYKSENTMTLGGTVIKTILLLIVVLCSTLVSYLKLEQIGFFNSSYLIVAAIGTIILGFVTSFLPKIAPITSVFYAAFEGVLLANLSFFINQYYQGIAMNAIIVTIIISFSMILVYMFNSSIGHRIRKAVIGMTLAIGLLYIFTFLLGLFNINIPYIYGNGIIGIGLSIFILIVASLNLIVDLDFISEEIQYGAPKYMEWYSAFGIMITLIWIYIRVLDLLTKLVSRDNN